MDDSLPASAIAQLAPRPAPEPAAEPVVAPAAEPAPRWVLHSMEAT